MITLTLPKDTEDRYVWFNNVMYGPFDPSYVAEGVLVPFDSTLTALEQGTGIYGENAVTHDKLSGNFNYHPLLHGMIPVPTAVYPNAMKFPCIDYNGTHRLVTANYGLAVSGGTSRYTVSGGGYHQFAFEKIDMTSWSVIDAIASYSDPTWIVQVTEIIFRLLPDHYIGAGQYWLSSHAISYSLGGGIHGAPDFRNPVSYDYLRSIPYGSSPGIHDSISSYVGYSFTADEDPSVSTRDAKLVIDSIVATIFPKEFPIEDKDYGDLAMEASETVNRNKVNMLEFLHDARHPTELIPKLKQLRHLKGMSNNYLTVHYGILPTVRDLENIVKAFRNAARYFDKNGFGSYTAGSTVTKNIDSMSYTLVQRIKLAIDDEDNELIDLINKIESAGFLPTFQNIWDLIPFSFVIDWFADVGGYLERLDANFRIARLNIRYVTMSRKTTSSGYSPPSVETPFVGTVEWVHYHRWVSDQCPVPRLILQPTFQDFNHWLESTALVIQRSK